MERLWYRILYMSAFIGALYSEQYTNQLGKEVFDEKPTTYKATQLMQPKLFTPEELNNCRNKQSSLAFLRKIVRFETSASQVELLTKKIRDLEKEVEQMECPPLPLEIE